MSFKLDLVFRDNYNACSNVPKTPAQSVQEQMSLATDRMTSAQRDKYAKIVVMSMYWETDDTGGEDDCNLFIETIAKLQGNKEIKPVPLKDDVTAIGLAFEMMDILKGISKIEKALWNKEIKPVPLKDDVTAIGLAFEMMDILKGISKIEKALFISQYAGHGWGSSDLLHLCCRIHDVADNTLDGPAVVFNILKDILKGAATDLSVDMVFVMDCCCAGVGGRGHQPIKGGRVEFMAATTERGISNSRKDGQTFTQSWCEAAEELLRKGVAFTTENIKTTMESQRELTQYPQVIVLREGMDLPIMFRPVSSTEITAIAPIVKWVIAAFHLEEDPEWRS